MSSEYQKPFSKVGYLNAELVTRNVYCGTDTKQWCDCPICEVERLKLKRKVNELLGREFYGGIDG